MFLKRLRVRKVLAFTLIEVMAVSGMMTAMSSGGSYKYVLDKAHETDGLNNLRQIYTLLQARSIEGPLPSAAFYPKDPLKDPKSIVKILNEAPKQMFISPFAPEPLRTSGLCYAWNDTVNGKELDRLPKNTWLMIDVAAFIADPKVSTPGKYLVLYADGRAEAITQLPEDIAKYVKDAKKKYEESQKPEPPKPAPKPPVKQASVKAATADTTTVTTPKAAETETKTDSTQTK